MLPTRRPQVASRQHPLLVGAQLHRHQEEAGLRRHQEAGLQLPFQVQLHYPSRRRRQSLAVRLQEVPCQVRGGPNCPNRRRRPHRFPAVGRPYLDHLDLVAGRLHLEEGFGPHRAGLGHPAACLPLVGSDEVAPAAVSVV